MLPTIAPTSRRTPTRQKILNLAVTEQDPFSALRYLRQRGNAPRLPELEEEGQAKLPGAEGALADISYALWDPEPQLKTAEDVPADRRYWHSMLSETLGAAKFQELHAITELSELKSLIGTIEMGETILVSVPEEDSEKLEELEEAQEAANKAQAQADQLQARAHMAGQLAEAAAQGPEALAQMMSGSGQPSNGKPQSVQGQSRGGQPQPPSGQPQSGTGLMTPEQAQALADELASQAREAKAQADHAREQAEGAQLQAEILAEELMGKPGSPEAADKLRELARIGQAALQAAQTKTEEISDLIEGWGLEEGELIEEGIPEALEIMQRMGANESFKKFAAILGRIRKIAARKARSKIAGEGARESRRETGRDIARAVPSELVALVVPALRVKALMRFARGELALRGEKRREKLGHGPVIVCEDGSGSMQGEKQMWAKATTLALAHYAKLQRRSFAWIHFGAKTTTMVCRNYPRGEMSAKQLLEVAETFRNASGTDFEKPLTEALRMIREEDLSKADIVLITDGECAVSGQFLGEFRKAKQALEFNVISVLCNVGSSSDSSVKQFSDSVEHVSAFTAETAEKQVFSRL